MFLGNQTKYINSFIYNILFQVRTKPSSDAPGNEEVNKISVSALSDCDSPCLVDITF